MGIMSTMTHRDARSLDHKTLEEMRRLAVKRVLAGEGHGLVGEDLEVHAKTVTKWMAWYRRDGEEGLASTKAGGRTAKLSPKQRQRLRRIVLEKNPRQLHFAFALWTLRLVGQVIERQFGTVLHKTTVWRLLRRMGITPQKPVRRAFQRDEAACRRWMTEEFPRIVREAKRRQATLLFEDESGVREDHSVGTTWGERGRRPVVEVTGTRRRTNVISAISPRGGMWFRCYGATLTAPLYVEFLKALLHDLRKPVVLIHDRHPAHVAAAVRRFLHKNRARLRVYELPAYAPNLNPDEHVWSYLKGTFLRNPIREDESLTARVSGSMDAIQADRALVRSFFEHPEVQYVKRALGW
jgi:transposase